MAEHFFVVGAQRSGTTYLYQLLDEHPDVCMARPVWPEPKFFFDDAKFANGVAWYEEKYFAHAEPGQLRGEKSVGYLESETSADRIFAAMPDASIVVILRDPVERAISNYRFSVESGLETLSIEEALTAEEAHRADRDGPWFVVGDTRVAANPFLYRRRGCYVDDLRLYARRFGRDQMRIMVFEDTVGSATALAGLYEFLGLDPGVVPGSLGAVMNPAPGRAAPLPESLRRELNHYFAPFNRALTDEFAVDVTSWAPAR